MLLSRFLYDYMLFFFFVPPYGYCMQHVLFTVKMIFRPHVQLSLPFLSIFIVDVCLSCMHPPIAFFTAVQPMTICLNILRTFIANFADSTILWFTIGMGTVWTFLPLFWCCNNCAAERSILRDAWCLIFYCWHLILLWHKSWPFAIFPSRNYINKNFATCYIPNFFSLLYEFCWSYTIGVSLWFTCSFIFSIDTTIFINMFSFLALWIIWCWG